ncbi:hypothetical protein RV02_GL003385 [Enterococcus gilvus]|nr:hypothetical protein RV02_GL003385 [Enterococcus gilvus]
MEGAFLFIQKRSAVQKEFVKRHMLCYDFHYPDREKEK